MKDKITYALYRFAYREDGLALTEYLILLGLLTAAVVAAVGLFGTNLGSSWNGWGGWLSTNTGAPAASTP